MHLTHHITTFIIKYIQFEYLKTKNFRLANTNNSTKLYFVQILKLL